MVGDRDIEAGTSTVRDRAGEEHTGIPFDELLAALAEEARTKAIEQTALAT